MCQPIRIRLSRYEAHQVLLSINPYVTNELSHPDHLDESTFILRGIRSNISFLFHFSMKFKSANRKAPDGTPRFAASHLGLFYLPMSHKKDTRLKWVNVLIYFLLYLHMKIAVIMLG